MASSQAAEIEDHQHRADGERDRREHGDRGVGVDAGPPDEIAVGTALVPRDRLADEPVDDAPAERGADAALGDPGEHAADHDARPNGRRRPPR